MWWILTKYNSLHLWIVFERCWKTCDRIFSSSGYLKHIFAALAALRSWDSHLPVAQNSVIPYILIIRLDCGDVGPEMRWFAIDIAIFEFRLAVRWAWTVRKRCQSLCSHPGSPPSWGSKLRTASQIDNFLIWFDGVTVNVIGCLAVLAVLSMDWLDL